MKKAQIEIVGLLIIVILIVVILLFAVLFNSGQEQTRQSALEPTSLRGSFGVVLMETSTMCVDSNNKNLTIREVLGSCVRDPDIMCGSITRCEAMNNTIEGILENTLDDWGYWYHLKLQSQGTTFTEVDRESCSEHAGQSQTDYYPFRISYSSGTGITRGDAMLTIKICP